MAKSNRLFKLCMIILVFVLGLVLVACDKQSADEKAAAKVIDAIEAVTEPVQLSEEFETSLRNARNLYIHLTLEQKALVSNIFDLEQKEEILQGLKDIRDAAAVDVLIAALPEEVSLENETAVNEANDAYEALNAEAQALVEKVDLLEEKVDAIASLNAIKNVNAKIDALPTFDKVALADKANIEAARKAFDKLTADEKGAVTNLQKLTLCESTLAELVATDKATKDQAAATEVDELISELPDDVNVSHKATVEEAREAYDDLTADQKALVTTLNKLEGAETRIANLEAANPVSDLITALPATVTAADETVIVAARTAYNALTADQKAFVTNLQTLVTKERDLSIAKNADLAVLLPVVESVPTQIVDDFTFPTTNGVTWSYKAGQDTTFFDLEAGKVLKNAYEVKNIILVAHYNNTDLEVTINFGLVKEGQTAVFYVGGAKADKPAGGNAWEGFGSYQTQLTKTGFGGVMIEVGNKVYFISEDAYIPLSGTTANEAIAREVLRPYGEFTFNGVTGYNNTGIINGKIAGFAGAGLLYQNTGDVAITFDAANSYGRENAGYLYGKVPFAKNTDGSYTVKAKLADHGDQNSIGPTGKVIVTLNPGDYLWTPHTWDVDSAGSGFGTRLCVAPGVLVENTPVVITKYKDLSPSPEEIILDTAAASIPANIVNDFKLPTTSGIVWTVKEGQPDSSFYDMETGEILRFVYESTPIVFVATLGDYSKEVTLTFGLDDTYKTEFPVQNTEELIDSIPTPVTVDAEDEIRAAITAYDALNAAQQAKVRNYADLVAAEAALADLMTVEYNLEYELNNGTNNEANPAKYSKATLPLTFAEPTRTGYTFGGWYANATFAGDAVTTVEAGTFGNRKFYAKWTITQYTITYNLDGGFYGYANREELATAFITDLYNYIKPADTTLSDFMHGAGKTTGFDGLWTTNADYKAKIYAKGDKTSDATKPYFANQPEYNAKWVPFFDLLETFIKRVNSAQSFWNDMTAGPIRLTEYMKGARFTAEDFAKNPWGSPNGYTITTATITLLAPTKAGNTFAGWYDNAEFTGTAVTTIALGSYGNKTLYAKWTPNA